MNRFSKTCVWAVAGCTLWAIFVRFYDLDSLPPQAWVDEIWYNLRARELLLTGRFHAYYRTFWGGMHPAMVELAAIVHLTSLGGVTASRYVSALAGVITVPLAYVALQEVFRTTDWHPMRQQLTSVLTAVVLSSLFYMILASRIGYEVALIPPVAIFYVWQTRLALAGGLANWVWAGAALGLAQYINLNGRFLVVLAVALGLHDLAYSTASQRRRNFHGLCLAAGMALLVAIPLIAFFVREPHWMFARSQHITSGFKQEGFKFLVDNALRIAASFSFIGDLDTRHNLPGRPMLDALQSMGFVAGLIWALRNFRTAPASRILLGWLFIMSLSSLLTDEAPQFERMIGVGVPVAALVAIGWVEIWVWLQSFGASQDSRHSTAWVVIAACGIATSVGLGTFDFFVRYPQSPHLATAMTTFPVDLARDLVDRAKTEAVFVDRITEAEDVYAFDFLMPGTEVRRVDFRHCLPLTDHRATRTTYLLFTQRDPHSAERLLGRYPKHDIKSFVPHAATLMEKATLVELPAGASTPLPGNVKHVLFGRGLRLLGYEISRTAFFPNDQMILTIYWRVEAEALHGLHRTFAHLGDATIGNSENSPCEKLFPPALWRPGDVVPFHIALRIPSETPPGNYPVLISMKDLSSNQPLPVLHAGETMKDGRLPLTSVTVLPH